MHQFVKVLHVYFILLALFHDIDIESILHKQALLKIILFFFNFKT